MTLLIILLCIALERYVAVGAVLKRFVWLDGYYQWIERSLASRWQLGVWRSYLLASLVLIVAVSLLYYSTWHVWYGSTGIIVSTFILLYCLGPDDLYHQLKQYFKAVQAGDSEQEKLTMSAITAKPVPASAAQAQRQLTLAIIEHANDRLFAVLFWFIVFGPIGALTYRVIGLLSVKLKQDSSVPTRVGSSINSLRAILDWIPARLTGIFYVLVGNFSDSFPVWWRSLRRGWQENAQLLCETGIRAAGVDMDASAATSTESLEVVRLLDRTLVMILLTLSILTLTATLA